MILADVANVKINFERAHFWLIRSHSAEGVGQPVRTFEADYIGIMVMRKDVVIPDYLFYVFMALHQRKIFKLIAHGTTQLMHIKVADIKSIPIAVR